MSVVEHTFASRADKTDEVAEECGFDYGEQLGPLSRLAGESDDSGEAEWARCGPNISPSELRRMERTRCTPTPEDDAARREARDFGMWWRNDMLNLRGALPDVDGKEVESAASRLGLVRRSSRRRRDSASCRVFRAEPRTPGGG